MSCWLIISYLKDLGPIRPGWVGTAEEDKVGDVDVEFWGERSDEGVPLPHCVGAHAVDEEEIGPIGLVDLRDPAVDHRAVTQIGGDRFQAGGAERAPVAPVLQRREADHTRLRHYD